jgi:hypothetical protein
MPRSAEESQPSLRLFQQAVGEGIDLAQAELSLARAEAAGLTKHYIVGLGFCVAAFVLAIATLGIFGVAAARAIAPHVHSAAMAYSIVGAAMVVLTLVLLWAGMSLLTRKPKPVGTIFKWLTGQQVKQ